MVNHGNQMIDENNPVRSSLQHQQIDDDETDLPEHTISMRSALRRCIQMSERLELMKSSNPKPLMAVHVNEKMRHRADSLEATRQEACSKFWRNLEKPQNGGGTKMIPVISSGTMSAHSFREEFHCKNLPCLIQFQGTDPEAEIQPFAGVDENWRNSNQEEINRDWFLEHVGANTKVPLRYSSESALLDSEGRATECETKEVSMSEWVEMLGNIGDTPMKETSYYLKDWHLQSQMKQRSCSCVNSTDPLYTCPEIFQYDLLNPFLSQFTKGDYKFCYWGPQGSKTLRHSDVLHSFSWSYNVHGTKQWTFFNNTDGAQAFTVIQKAGQAMFVPCTWQHEVENLEETISINHNWITVANIDKTWECLMTEMEEIEHELEGWGFVKDTESYLESCESMLRGCVGLDVTAFFTMNLLRLLELLTANLETQTIETQPTKIVEAESGGNSYNETMFECYRLMQMMKQVMQVKNVQLEKRIQAVTTSKKLAVESIHAASVAFGLVCID
eukprot:scaffold119_cov131-Cylindrotheca_fusiformis.AAC.5